MKAGERYKSLSCGWITVIKYIDRTQALVEFEENRTRVIAQPSNARRGNVKNPNKPLICGIGYFGIGLYSAKTHRKIYTKWEKMLKRCYNEKIHEKQPTYKDCHVVKSWHNFQNFASWYVQQKGHDLDWHLDKDILVKGNKVYGPKRCCLVPVHINSLLTKHDAGRGNLPIGVSKHQNKYRVRCMLNKVNTTIGIYYSVKKAFKAYKETKEAEIKRVAKLYKNEIDPKVYKALMDYEVEIDD